MPQNPNCDESFILDPRGVDGIHDDPATGRRDERSNNTPEYRRQRKLDHSPQTLNVQVGSPVRSPRSLQPDPKPSQEDAENAGKIAHLQVLLHQKMLFLEQLRREELRNTSQSPQRSSGRWSPVRASLERRNISQSPQRSSGRSSPVIASLERPSSSTSKRDSLMLERVPSNSSSVRGILKPSVQKPRDSGSPPQTSAAAGSEFGPFAPTLRDLHMSLLEQGQSSPEDTLIWSRATSELSVQKSRGRSSERPDKLISDY
jgi:hypothetical protein